MHCQLFETKRLDLFGTVEDKFPVFCILDKTERFILLMQNSNTQLFTWVVKFVHNFMSKSWQCNFCNFQRPNALLEPIAANSKLCICVYNHMHMHVFGRCVYMYSYTCGCVDKYVYVGRYTILIWFYCQLPASATKPRIFTMYVCKVLNHWLILISL